QTVIAGNQPNFSTGIQEHFDEENTGESGSKDPQNTDDDTTFEVKEPNGVNAASTSVPAIRQNSTNSTNTFSVAGPSNTVVRLTIRKSSYVDPSQYPDDPNMPALEDITYSDDEEDFGAEADFSSLETSIHVDPILTTRVHKDHPVT
nr:hypothetical protein [Tanacetum cinerariifolium]